MTKQERQALADDLARVALEWTNAGLLEGRFGVPYDLDQTPTDHRDLARILSDVLERAEAQRQG